MKMNDIAGNYIRLIDTADSVDKISEITNRAAWDDITNQEYCEIYDYAVNKVRDWRQMKMNGRDLNDCLLYNGMIKDARKLALKDKMATAEELALMSELEICDLIVKNYEVVMGEDERVLLIPKDKMDEFKQMAVYLCR